MNIHFYDKRIIKCFHSCLYRIVNNIMKSDTLRRLRDAENNFLKRIDKIELKSKKFKIKLVVYNHLRV